MCYKWWAPACSVALENGDTMCQLSNMYCWFILKCVVFVETQHLNDSGFLDIFINCNQAMKKCNNESHGARDKEK